MSRVLKLLICGVLLAVTHSCFLSPDEKLYRVDRCNLYLTIDRLDPELDYNMIRIGRSEDSLTDTVIINWPRIDSQDIEIFVPDSTSADIYVLDPYDVITYASCNSFRFHIKNEMAKTTDWKKLWVDPELISKESTTIKLDQRMYGFSIYDDSCRIGKAKRVRINENNR